MKITCGCGSVIEEENMYFHKSTRKHLKSIGQGDQYKSKWNAKSKERVKCLCGGSYLVGSGRAERHNKSKKHGKWDSWWENS